MMRRIVLGILVLGIIVFTHTGCIVVPLIDGFNQMGLSKADREMLLPKQVKKFQEALYWGQPLEAVAMVKDEVRDSISTDLQKKAKDVRIVESKIELVQYTEESNKATVTVNVRHYKIPFYVVIDRVEEQSWEFSLSKGWQYVSAKEITKK